ncbi:MAG: DoxX family protein [Armatimonadota bacterium]
MSQEGQESPRASAADLGLLLLRLAPAVIFGAHGYLKVLGGHFDRTVALFMTVNIPAPEPLAWVVGITELVGGVLLAIGFLTRAAAGLLAFDLVVAIAKVRWPQGFIGAWEFEFVLICACLALVATGAGRISFDAVRPRRGTRRR